MKAWREGIAAAAIALVCAATPMRAQSPVIPLAPYRARILGVFNAQTGDPIEGASVTDILSGTSALTTITGTVSLAFLPDSGSIVRVQKIGYKPATAMVAISPKDTVPITVLLSPSTTTLPAVVTNDSSPHYISPGLRAFEERRKAGFGLFMTEAELRKNDNRAVSNVIRTMGVNVACGGRPIRCFAASSRTGGVSCILDVYLDGIMVNKDDRDLEKMRTDQFAGIEAYTGAATIPPLYNKTGSACGVLLFWTRER
jgi:hypothetical protein